ncbi:glycosyl hydrolase family 65 protein, partial [Microbispora rosea]
RARDGRLRFAPRLPSGITRLTFRVRYRGRLLRVDITQDGTTYRLLHGPPLTLSHHGEELTLGAQPQARRNAPPPFPDLRVKQPPGREPAPRRPGDLSRDLIGPAEEPAEEL